MGELSPDIRIDRVEFLGSDGRSIGIQAALGGEVDDNIAAKFHQKACLICFADTKKAR